MLGLDVSWDAYKITPAWCAVRQAEGYRVLVVCLWSGSKSPKGVEQALRYWREAGGITMGYYVPHSFRPPPLHLGSAMKAAGAEWKHLAALAIDVEDIGSGDSMDRQWDILDLRASVSLVVRQGLRPILYTSRTQRNGLGESTRKFLSNFRLWDASHNIPPSLEKPAYGDWFTRMGHQYQGTTLLDGVEVDLNLFDDRFFTSFDYTALYPEEKRLTRDEDVTHALNTIWGWAELLEAPPGLRRTAQKLASKELQDAVRILKGE